MVYKITNFQRALIVGNFLRSKCHPDIQGSIPAACLYNEFVKWYNESRNTNIEGECPVTNTAFGLELTRRGINKKITGTGKIRRGISFNEIQMNPENINLEEI
jgi:hypothetical protein